MKKRKVYEAKLAYEVVCEAEAFEASCPSTVANVLRDFFEEKKLDVMKEHVLAVHTDRKNQIMAIDIVSIGTVSSSLLHPREIFRKAIISGASGIILAHNHPSGDCAPSRADVQVTQQVREAANVLQIDLLDHVIFSVCTLDHYSFKDASII